MRLRFSRRAERDLVEIASHIAIDSPKSAYLVVRRLRANGAALLDNPLAFPLWLDLPAKGLRRRISGSHLIFYKVEDDTVFVVRILHGMRDVRTIIREEL